MFEGKSVENVHFSGNLMKKIAFSEILTKKVKEIKKKLNKIIEM